MPNDDEPLIPLAQAALRLGITHGVAYAHARQGKLHATLIKGKLMVPTAEITRYREEAIAHPPQGRHRSRKPKQRLE